VRVDAANHGPSSTDTDGPANPSANVRWHGHKSDTGGLLIRVVARQSDFTGPADVVKAGRLVKGDDTVESQIRRCDQCRNTSWLIFVLAHQQTVPHPNIGRIEPKLSRLVSNDHGVEEWQYRTQIGRRSYRFATRPPKTGLKFQRPNSHR